MKRYAVTAAALFLVVFSEFIPLRASGVSYTVENLGTIGGFVPTITGMNAAGQISGFVTVGPGQNRAVRYTNGVGWQYVPGLQNIASVATGINASGALSGYENGLVSGQGMRAFRYTDAGGVTVLGTLSGGTFSQGFAINDNGDVVGSGNATGVSSKAWKSAAGSVTPVALPAPSGSSFSKACGINTGGWVAGIFVASGVQHGYRISPSGATEDLGSLDGPSGKSSSCAIDDFNRVGGFSAFAGLTHAFRYDQAPMVDLDSFGSSFSQTNAVSNGVSVGFFTSDENTGDTHAFAQSGTDPTLDLNDQLVPGTGWVLAEALAVNSNGQIAGDGTVNGVFGVFRLTPQAGDTTPPVIAPHADVTAEATSANGALVNYSAPSATDNVDATVVVNCTPASGSNFVMGTTAVTCNASDAAGNAATPTTFNVVVSDTTPPVIAAHADVTASATDASGASVTYTSPSWTDAVDVSGTANCSPASGSTFALGATTVTCNAKDAAGNAATPTMFSVVVKDTTAPVIAAHADVTAEATSASGATVTYTSPATSDNVDAPGTATCSPASGTTFALGSTPVTCNAKDAAGNAAAPTTFNVVVKDTTAPVIAAHGDVTAEASGASGASVSYAAPATSDNVDAPGTASCAPASGTTFALGTTTVTCNAKDAAGNAAAPTTFNVVVKDTTAPVIAAHADVSAEATSAGGASVGYTAPATTDAVSGPGSATCAPASGSTFALGTTTVTCNAKDAAGNAAAPTTFNVVVKDTTAPVIAPHGDVTASATDPAGVSVFYSAPSTTDAVSGPGVAACAPASGSVFPVGTTTVTCGASDAAGNAAVPTTFRVVVTYAGDTTPPVISMVYASPDQIWPPNGKMVPVNVMVTVTDNMDPSPSCSLTSVIGGTVGSTAITGQLSANVRADNGAGYVLTVTCSDASGNKSTASTNVSVTKTNGNSGAPKANGKQ